MKFHQSILIFVLLLAFGKGFSQPYVDLANFNYQQFSSSYKDHSPGDNTTSVYALNLLLPLQFKNGDALLFRVNSETIHSERELQTTPSSNLSSLSVAMGYQWTSESQKWKTTVFAIPKVASDFDNAFARKDWQYGGLFLEAYTFSPTLQIKFGLFANREAFGNFFIPLLGVDWKPSDRMYCYGVLPASYKFEYNAVKNKMYAGFQFKTQTRSFHITTTAAESYVRFDEVALKLFADYYVLKNVVINAEAGYAIGKNPRQYDTRSDQLSYANPIYNPLKNCPIFSIGVAYRVRDEISEK